MSIWNLRSSSMLSTSSSRSCGDCSFNKRNMIIAYLKVCSKGSKCMKKLLHQRVWISNFYLEGISASEARWLWWRKSCCWYTQKVLLGIRWSTVTTWTFQFSDDALARSLESPFAARCTPSFTSVTFDLETSTPLLTYTRKRWRFVNQRNEVINTNWQQAVKTLEEIV